MKKRYPKMSIQRFFLSLCLLWPTLTAMSQTAAPVAVGDYRTLTLPSGLPLAYREQGSGPQVLLMLHGLGGESAHYERLMPLLSAHYRCIALDFPAYGRSGTGFERQGDAMAFLSETVRGLLDALQLQQVLLMGHSMGGQVAMVFALQHPERVSRLLLLAPAGLETFTEQEADALRRSARPAVYEGMQEAQIRQLFSFNFATLSDYESLVQARLALRESDRFPAFCQMVSWGVHGMLGHPVYERLPELRLPTLLLFGAQDLLIPNRLLHPGLTTAQVLQQGSRIPGSSLHLIEQAGHLLQYEQPQAVAQAVRDFLRRTP